MASNLDEMLGQLVVLDTNGPIFYLGRLIHVDDRVMVLADADLHNASEGHATREQYIAESARDGIRVNRRRVFVLRPAVYSVSLLEDVVAD